MGWHPFPKIGKSSDGLLRTDTTLVQGKLQFWPSWSVETMKPQTIYGNCVCELSRYVLYWTCSRSRYYGGWLARELVSFTPSMNVIQVTTKSLPTTRMRNGAYITSENIVCENYHLWVSLRWPLPEYWSISRIDDNIPQKLDSGLAVLDRQKFSVTAPPIASSEAGRMQNSTPQRNFPHFMNDDVSTDLDLIAMCYRNSWTEAFCALLQISNKINPSL